MLNAQNSYDVKTYGSDGEAVVIIDDFIKDFNAIRKIGQTSQYQSNGGFYPGIQAVANGYYLQERGPLLLEILRDVFDYSKGIQVESCTYSLVSKAAKDLHQLQRIPHYDDQNPKLFALLHYVQGPEDAGTAFYRHKRTGFEHITPMRAQDYQTALEVDIQEYGEPPAEYIKGETTAFELMLKVKAKPNRAILYRGRTLHSGIIPKSLTLTTDPKIARMTINTFLWAA